jgi:hypothetical protein
MKTAEEKNLKALRQVRYDAPARGHTRGLDVVEEAARPLLPSLVVGRGQLMQDLPNFWMRVTGHYYFPGMCTAILRMIPGIYGIRKLLGSQNGRSR